MNVLKNWIPLKIKSPLAIFIREWGKYPFGLVYKHMLRTYIEEGGNVSQNKKEKIHRDIHRKTLDFLSIQYKYMIAKNADKYMTGTKPITPMIWVFWWQGEDNAPEIVKRCISSIRKNSYGMKVCIIDSQNYQQFVSVPLHILKKLNSGTISFTHFSDYYRMALLASHGGMWIDASIYLKGRLPAEILELPIYTVRNPGGDSTNVSNWEWTVGVMAGWKGNTLFSTVENLLSEYWKTHDNVVDYFLFDYMIRLTVNYCEGLRKDIARIPINNTSFMYLQDHLDDAAEEYVRDFYFQNTVLYKVSWKNTYPKYTKDKKETVYSMWIKGNL